MSDIFREVEEEVRRERYEQLWNKYRDHIIAAAALVIIGSAGFQLYRVYEQRAEERAAVAYAAATQLLDRGQPGAASSGLANLAKTAPAGYSQVARLAEADALFGAGSHGAAVRLYQQIATGSDPYLGAVARIRAAWAIVDGAPRSEVEALLAPLTDQASPWHDLAREVLAYDDLRAGETAVALKSYEQISSDANAPSSLRTRAGAMTRFLKAGGDANYGSVPPPAPAQSPPLGPKAAVPVR